MSYKSRYGSSYDQWTTLDKKGNNNDAHYFGTQSPETVRIKFNGNATLKPHDAVTTTITESRKGSSIALNASPEITFYEGKTVDSTVYEEVFNAVVNKESSELPTNTEGNKNYDSSLYTILFLSYDAAGTSNDQWVALETKGSKSGSHSFGTKTSEKVRITFNGNDEYKACGPVEATLTCKDDRQGLTIIKHNNPTLDYYVGKYAKTDVGNEQLRKDIVYAVVQSAEPAEVIESVKVEYNYSGNNYAEPTITSGYFGDSTSEKIRITYSIKDESKGQYKDTIVEAILSTVDQRNTSEVKTKSNPNNISWYKGKTVTNDTYQTIYNAIVDKENSVPKAENDYDATKYEIQYQSKYNYWDNLDNTSTSSSRHLFGGNMTDGSGTEQVRIRYLGDETHKPSEYATVQVNLGDGRQPSVVTKGQVTDGTPINPNWEKDKKEQEVWEAIINTNDTKVGLSDVTITYYAGHFIVDLWEPLNYKPETNVAHKFGEYDNERIKISYPGNDEYKPFDETLDFKVKEKTDPTLVFNDDEYYVNPELTNEKEIEKDLLTTILSNATPETLFGGTNVSITYKWSALSSEYVALNSNPLTDLAHKFGDKTIFDSAGNITENINIIFEGDENYKAKTWNKTIKIGTKLTPILNQKENPRYLYYDERNIDLENIWDAIVESTIPNDVFKKENIGSKVTIEYYAGNSGTGIVPSYWRPIIDESEKEESIIEEVVDNALTHKFGEGFGNTEKIRITFNGNINAENPADSYGPKSWVINLELYDDRLETKITAPTETIELKYYDTAENLAAAIKEEIIDEVKVYYYAAEDTNEENLLEYSFDESEIEVVVTSPLNVQSDAHEVIVRFKGNDSYRKSSTEVKVKISKARARLSVADLETHTYDKDTHEPTITVKGIDPASNENMGYIALVGGADANVEGFFSIGLSDTAEKDLPQGIAAIYKILKEVIGDEGINLGEFRKRIANYESLIEFAGKLGLTDSIGIDPTVFNNILDAIDKMNIGNGVKITLGTGPKDAGVYVTTAVSIDNNYEFTMDMGSMIILQKGLNPKDNISLEFNTPMTGNRERLADEVIAQTSIEKAVQMGLISNEMYERLGLNNISNAVKARTLTIEEASSFDWGGKLTSTDTAYTIEEAAQDNVHAIYIGMTAEGEIYAKAEHPTKPGVYSETVYVWLGNYFAMPITRVFRIQKHPSVLTWNETIGTDTVLSDSEQDAIDLAKLTLLGELAEYGITEFEEIKAAMTVPVDKVERFDFGAYLYSKGDDEKAPITTEGVQANVETLFAGLTSDGKTYLDKEAPSEAGIYVELAYVIHGDYSATPIIRAFRIGKLATRIELACGENTGNIFTVTYTGEPVDIDATLFQKMPEDTESGDVKIEGIEPEISYIGYDDRKSGLFFKDAPTNAGIYLVRAKFDGNDTYLPSDEEAILIIKKAEIKKLKINIEDSVYGDKVQYEIEGKPKGIKVDVEYAIDAPILKWFYSDTVPTSVGNYVVRAVVPESRNYEGAVAYDKFKITARPLEVKLNKYTYHTTYLEGPDTVTPIVENVVPGDRVYKVLVYEGKDNYGNSYKSIFPPTNAGKYTVTLQLFGRDLDNYTWSPSKSWYFVRPRDINSDEVDVRLRDYLIYNGKVQQQRLLYVKDNKNGRYLSSRDYDVVERSTYAKDARDYNFVIKGTGNYKGWTSAPYEMHAKRMYLAFNKWAYVSTYGEKEPVKVNMFGDVAKDNLCVKLTYEGTTVSGKPYSSNRAPKDAGFYKVTAELSGRDKNNYACAPITTSFVVLRKNLENSADIRLTEKLTYNGKVQDQDFKVFVKGQIKPLVEGKDYVVIYNSDKARNAGKYTLKIMGINNYAGVLAKDFTVSQKEVTVNFKHTPYDDSVYMEHYDKVDTRIKGLCRRDKLDLIYTYFAVDEETHETTYKSTKRPTDAGEYIVVASINPKDKDARNYRIKGWFGVVSTKYVVNPKSIETADIELEGDALVFGEDNTQPFNATIKLRHGREVYELVEGKDFDVEYEEITKPGVYDLILKGKGNFSEEVSVPFVVLAKDDDEASAAGLINEDGTLGYGNGSIDVYVKGADGDNDFFEAKFDRSAVAVGSGLKAQELSELVREDDPHVLELFFVVTQPEVPEEKTEKLSKQIGNIFDVDFFKRYDRDDSKIKQLSDSGADVRFTIDLTKEMKNPDPDAYRRDYTLITEHEGKLAIMGSKYVDEDNTITFATHLFSKYYVGYVDVPLAVRTGDANNMALWFIMAIMASLLAGVAGYYLYRRKKEEE